MRTRMKLGKLSLLAWLLGALVLAVILGVAVKVFSRRI